MSGSSRIRDKPMGNQTNDRNWAAMERLRFIESTGWWRGTVQRQDVAGVFGVSLAQASSDLQRYLELNPSAFSYNLRKKRYEALAGMRCVLTVPDLDEAVARFLGGVAPGPRVTDVQGGGDCVAVLEMPLRRAPAEVERRIVLAIVNGLRVRVRYASIHGGREEWRWIRPHALGHNGARWHARAWCEKSSGFRDFTLSRMAEIEWSREEAPLPEPDFDWEEIVTLRVRANQRLGPEQVRAVERDFGMSGGLLKLRVRRAMEGYLRDRLGLGMADGRMLPNLLEEIPKPGRSEPNSPSARF